MPRLCTTTLYLGLFLLLATLASLPGGHLPTADLPEKVLKGICLRSGTCPPSPRQYRRRCARRGILRQIQRALRQIQRSPRRTQSPTPEIPLLDPEKSGPDPETQRQTQTPLPENPAPDPETLRQTQTLLPENPAPDPETAAPDPENPAPDPETPTLDTAAPVPGRRRRRSRIRRRQRLARRLPRNQILALLIRGGVEQNPGPNPTPSRSPTPPRAQPPVVEINSFADPSVVAASAAASSQFKVKLGPSFAAPGLADITRPTIVLGVPAARPTAIVLGVPAAAAPGPAVVVAAAAPIGKAFCPVPGCDHPRALAPSGLRNHVTTHHLANPNLSPEGRAAVIAWATTLHKVLCPCGRGMVKSGHT